MKRKSGTEFFLIICVRCWSMIKIAGMENSIAGERKIRFMVVENVLKNIIISFGQENFVGSQSQRICPKYVSCTEEENTTLRINP